VGRCRAGRPGMQARGDHSAASLLAAPGAPSASGSINSLIRIAVAVGSAPSRTRPMPLAVQSATQHTKSCARSNPTRLSSERSRSAARRASSGAWLSSRRGPRRPGEARILRAGAVTQRSSSAQSRLAVATPRFPISMAAIPRPSTITSQDVKSRSTSNPAFSSAPRSRAAAGTASSGASPVEHGGASDPTRAASFAAIRCPVSSVSPRVTRCVW